MVSFDVASLYTNVPLTETIDIILKHLYDGHAKPPTISREDMKELLDLATKKSHFLFNGQLYDQIDGVSMGSPRQLNLVYTPTTPISAPSPTTDTVVLRVPYFGQLSQVYAKRIISVTNKSYPLKHIRLVYDVQERIQSGFTLKDQIPDPMQAGVVYEATCPQCEVHYIGKTFRHFKTRVHEHLNYQKQDVCFKKIEKSKHTVKRPRSIIKTPIERKGPITRSQTGKLPTRTIQTTQEDIGKLVKNPEILEKRIRQQTPKTAIAKHYDTTGHIFSNNDFAIRLKERSEIGNKKVARLIHCDAKTVRYWRTRWKETKDLSEKTQSGQPRSTTAAEDEMILNELEENENPTSVTITRDFKIKTVEISSRTVQRRL
ncbi:unnamed protein product [Rotaria sp. Silwood2]|nr:unnamed protein product [Rotaria sp. Silwood2]